jgi:ethanolamine ammonia-lyase small subunit
MKPPRPLDPGPLAHLRERTPARVALGHCGAGLPTQALLEFQLDYARARDAVHEGLDAESVVAQLASSEVIQVQSQARDRTTYLQRPDLGRRLAPEYNDALAPGPYDVAFILGDGLSARAVQLHAAPTLQLIVRALTGWRVAPVIIATQARVALGDDIGSRLNAAFSVMLIGERPGLSAPYSLGAYLTGKPTPGRRDHERNCISNIRPPQGLAYAEAAARVVWLLHAARRMGRTGFLLKDDSAMLQPQLPGDSASGIR